MPHHLLRAFWNDGISSAFAVIADIEPRLVNERDAMANVTIVTFGWHYDTWREPFFPSGQQLKAQLQYYTSQFDSVELNGVFYRTPSEDAVRSLARRHR
jgi:hypothetical protein